MLTAGRVTTAPPLPTTPAQTEEAKAEMGNRLAQLLQQKCEEDKDGGGVHGWGLGLHHGVTQDQSNFGKATALDWGQSVWRE